MKKSMNTKNDIIYTKLIKTIKEKIPERGKLTNMLADTLCIEKEAVYRRLRGEVPFTFAEVSTIANQFDISVDNIIRTSHTKNHPFQMKMIDFINPTETDFFMIENFAEILEKAKNDPDSESGTASNVIPINICIAYKHIYRFHLLKWMYQLGETEQTLYVDITPSEKLEKINQNTVINTQQVGRTFYIWDKNIIPSLINDIQYFREIHLITQEEIAAIKDELFLMLNDLERMAIIEQFDSGKKVEFYVSSLNFETSYSYVQAQGNLLSVIRSFTLNDTTSLDEAVFYKIKKWMTSLIRTSALISGSNEIQRIIFFEHQREIVSKL